MFKTLTVLGAALAFTAQEATVAAATVPMKVMSFNVRTSNANDPCPAGCWDQRKNRIKPLLDRYTPDFIGTQETAPVQTQFFQSTLGYAAVGECAGECGGNERNSIFYNSGTWQLLSGSTFALSDTPDVLGSNQWGLEYLRAAVLARFQHRASGHTACILNTHYDITRGQPQSSVLVAKRMAAVCKDTDAVVMMGDLNTPPNTAAIGYLMNTAQINGAYTPFPMYETLSAAGAGGPTWIGGSFGGQVSGQKIDYIFSRRDSRSCLRSAKVITDTFGGYGVSDHAVVQSEFTIGGPCTSC